MTKGLSNPKERPLFGGGGGVGIPPGNDHFLVHIKGGGRPGGDQGMTKGRPRVDQGRPRYLQGTFKVPSRYLQGTFKGYTSVIRPSLKHLYASASAWQAPIERTLRCYDPPIVTPFFGGWGGLPTGNDPFLVHIKGLDPGPANGSTMGRPWYLQGYLQGDGLPPH